MKRPHSKAETSPPPQQAATRVQPVAPPPRKRRSKQRLWLATGLAVGLFASLILWLDGRQQAREAPKKARSTAGSQEVHREPPAPRFGFYQELPAHGTPAPELTESQVVVTPKLPVPAATQPAPSTASLLGEPAPAPVSPVEAAALPDLPARPDSELNALLQQLQSVQHVRFILQAGSWSTPEGASAVRERLKAGGLNTSVESVQIGKKTFYRVMVGPFDEKVDADRMEQRLRSAGFNPLQRRLE